MIQILGVVGPKGPRPDDFDVFLNGERIGTLFKVRNGRGEFHAYVTRSLHEVSSQPNEKSAAAWLTDRHRETLKAPSPGGGQHIDTSDAHPPHPDPHDAMLQDSSPLCVFGPGGTFTSSLMPQDLEPQEVS